VGFLVLVTAVWSATVNLLTAARRYPPAGLTYVRTGTYQTRYLHWGSGGSPIVLIHGAFESADTWQPTARLLARTHQVYALDLAGFGYTEHRGHYTLDDQTRQVLAFLDALQLRRPVLVAHSSGAAIAAEATLRAPDRVGGLLLLDGDALATGAGARSPMRYLVLPPYRITLLRLGLRADWLIRVAYQRQCGPGCPRLDAAGVDVWRRPFQVAGAEAAAWALLDQGVPGLPPGRLAQLATLPLPKAVVFGAQDTVFSPDSAAQTAARIGAPPPTLIPGARHLTMISSPAAVTAAVDALAARA
jgi:pimeloyl-ACP methyl ester carboxylesterase